MGILPLCTGIILDPGKTHDTNSPAENWMRILKHNILQKKSRMTPSDCIIETRATLKGHIREYESRGSDIPPKKDKRREKSKDTFLGSEEVWGGKKGKKYFVPPPLVPRK